MNLRQIVQTMRSRFARNKPLIEVGLSRANLLHNLNTYKASYPTLKFAPVLKSNAYGHGLIQIAKLLDSEAISFFMVDSIYEARMLRHAGIRSRIVVMGYVRPEEIVASRLRDVDFALVDIEQLRAIAKTLTSPVRFHLKIDTGMHRQGVVPHDLFEALALIESNTNMQLVGLCSHFADAESATTLHTDNQIKIWNAARAKVHERFPTFEFVHFAATKGIKRAHEIGINTVRLGIGLYGLDTSLEGDLPLKPVLELRSIVTSLRAIAQSDSVGYNATFIAQRDALIATVPLGYFEGIDRELSNVGSMLVRGQLAPIAGRVSMNMSSLDVSQVVGVARGDKVIAISRDPKDKNSILNMARTANTSPYVLLVHIRQHLRRVVE